MNFWMAAAGRMAANLKVAVLGAGYFAQFPHEAWGRIPGARLVAVADLDPSRAARAAMQDGLIGQPMQITFRLRTGDGQGARAYLDRQPYFQQMPKFLVHETAVHWIVTFRYLAGDPVDVYADLRRENPAIAGEGAGYILSSHPNGVRSIFDGNRHLDHPADNHRLTLGEALIEGTTGTLSLLGFGELTLRAFGSTDNAPLLQPQDWLGFAGDCVHALQKHVVRGALHGAPLETKARDYLTVRRIENAAYASAANGAKIKLDGAA